MNNMSGEIKELERAIEEIIHIAKGLGLDFYPMRFEICPAEIIYTFGAYGMPARYTHWSFGKAYHKLKMQYDFNLSRIYEMVINSNPCYAFLLEGNSLIQNKLVVAHVLAHCDFFKNNAWFRNTNRDMLESMSIAAQRFRSYELRYGRERVEQFLDAVMAIQQHINPHHSIKEPGPKKRDCCSERRQTPYDDLWDLDKPKGCSCGSGCHKKTRRFPEKPERDLMLFMMKHAKDLEEWQRDIISVLRDEMLYFWPQMQTKIINEGWASYWHVRIMRELDLDEWEAVEFAKMHAGVIQPSTKSINPYYLGIKIFEDIEKRWDNPSEEERQKYNRKGGEGREKIFEVRSIDNDVSFIRNYLTKELVEELDLYLFRRVGHDYKITDKDWETVRDGLIKNLTNCGVPYIVVENGDYGKRGELYLKHCYEGLELDVVHLEKTLPHVYLIWGRPVHLETKIDEKPVLFSYDGEKITKKFI
ncbi:stage V sporulation protein R [Desulfohalotomaculum tongense]|uniref:SpoVR family protein n=1 Tax=Desulforadius tongensis TaxID=1216062 RepID=UPI00195DB1B6|nr:SpoVR family protein [Desulforadius tongensis]MBM7854321.1 stage V sporulation protein R [Desulforadius tongensis]